MKKTKFLKKKILLVFVITFVVAYLMALCLPYSGGLEISETIKDSFAEENFYSETVSKERAMLLDDPDIAFIHYINAIKKAENKILLSTFLFHQGESSDILVGALLDAADRGVEISILIDKWSAIPNNYKYCFINNSNINYYVFNPLNILKPQHINSSLHDKFIIIDNKYLILGGRNIGDEYFVEDTARIKYDFDILIYNTDVDFRGGISQVKEYYYELIDASVTKSYNKISEKNQVIAANEEQRLLDCFFLYSEAYLDNNEIDYDEVTVPANKITLIHNNLMENTKKEPVIAYTLLNLAKSGDDIVILSPYVVLTEDNFDLFSDAIKGKNVTLITDSLAATKDWSSYSNYYINRNKYLEQGINIYEFQSNNATLHGKCYLFDDRLTVIGSFNLDERSIRVDTESMIVIDSQEFNALTKASQQKYMNKCLQVNPETNKYYDKADVEPAKVSWYKKVLYIVLGYIINIVKYLV